MGWRTSERQGVKEAGREKTEEVEQEEEEQEEEEQEEGGGKRLGAERRNHLRS